jgi:hypothetical protein
VTATQAKSDRLVIFLRCGIASVFLTALTRTSADPDLWGHLRVGADIVATGRLPGSDAYSFTALPTWVDQSWLADVLMHLAYATGGTPWLVVGKVLLATATLAVVSATLRRARVPGPTFELLLFVALVAMYGSVTTVRPQLFSLCLFAALLDVLSRRDGPRPAALVLVAAIMAAWANLHGAWLLGLGTLGLWGAGELVQPPRTVRRSATIVALGLLAGLATLATPYGITLWASLRDTMGASLQDVSEWRAITESPWVAPLATWLALAGLAVYAVRGTDRRWGHVFVLAWLAWSSWRVRRLLPFFGLAAVAFVAPQCAAFARRLSSARAKEPPTLRPILRIGLIVATIVLVAVNAMQAARALDCLRIDHSREADVAAARFIASNHLRGRMLTYSDWGLYAIWHFAPAIRVSLDGRRELRYPLAELRRHNAIYWNAPSALADVDALAPGYVWLPANLPVIAPLRAHGWRLVFSSQRSVVLARPGDATAYTTPAPRDLPECFPADPD